MKRCALFSKAWLLAISLLVVGNSPALAQKPLPPPTLLRPLTNGILNVPGSDAISTGDGARVAFTHVAEATHYYICFRAPGNICQDQRNPPLQSMFAVTARINSSIPVAPGGTIEFFLPIPDALQGNRIEWFVKSCTGPIPSHCETASSAIQTVIVLLPSARPRSFVPTTMPANRVVTFAWNNHNLADAAPQLIVLPNAHQPTLATIFKQANPTIASFPGLSIPLDAGNQVCPLSTGFGCQMTLPNQLGPAVKWAVLNCRNFQGKGRRCSQLITTWQVMKVDNIFSTALALTFTHDRCVNCHKVNAPNGGFPSGHTSNPNCTQCHVTQGPGSLLPADGNINPGWVTPAGTQDFRKGPTESVAQHIQRLCSMAKEPVIVNGQQKTGYQHLTEDKLVLWAVNPNPNGNGNVLLPSGAGSPRPPAPPGNIAAWRSAVFTWWFMTQKACD